MRTRIAKSSRSAVRPVQNGLAPCDRPVDQGDGQERPRDQPQTAPWCPGHAVDRGPVMSNGPARVSSGVEHHQAHPIASWGTERPNEAPQA